MTAMEPFSQINLTWKPNREDDNNRKGLVKAGVKAGVCLAEDIFQTARFVEEEAEAGGRGQGLRTLPLHLHMQMVCPSPCPGVAPGIFFKAPQEFLMGSQDRERTALS